MEWSVKKWGETSNLMVDGCSSSAVKWPFRGCTPSNRPKLSKQQRSATWQAHSKHVSKSISFTALSSMSENRTWTLHFQLIQHTKKRTNSCNPGKWEQAPKKSGDLKFFDLQFILMFIIQFGQSYPTSHYIPLPPHWFSSDSWNSWLPSFLLAGVFGEFGSFEVSWNMMFSGLGFRRCQVLPWRHLGQGRDVRKMWMKSPSKNMRKAQPIELMLSSWLDVAVD